jgi:hypothetical protein
MYCPAASLISTLKSSETKEVESGAIVRSDQAYPRDTIKTAKSQDSLYIDLNENGEQFLHLVLPKDKINFLNGMDGQSIFGPNGEDRCKGANTGQADSDGYDQTLYEVSCRIEEVNRVYYR